MRIEPDDPSGDWTTPGVYEVSPGLYRIPMPLPTDGLKAVNVYALRDGEGLVLIDAGWAVQEARAALEKAVGALDHGLADVHRILVTHVHRDHYTLGVWLRREFGNRIALGEQERGSLRLAADPDRDPWSSMSTQLHRAGAGELVDELRGTESSHDVTDWEDPDEWLTAPSEIALRERTLQAVHTPGHTRGHLVFVDPARDGLFSGDHVLPHITPSLGFEAHLNHSPLGDFLDSLRMVRSMPDRRMLPAHGPVSPSVHHRVDELIEHHAGRLDAMAALVEAGAPTAYVAAQRLTWTRRAKRHDELDLFNRCIAVIETAAHLDLLAEQGRLTRTVVDDVRHYQA